MYKLGVDVGGTNTDAVLVRGKNQVVNSIKVHTTNDVESGIQLAISTVLEKVDIDKNNISNVMLGTTQCTNAIVERKHLNHVGIIRIGKPATEAILPMTEWPEDLVGQIGDVFEIVSGGFEFDGSMLTRFDENEVVSALKQWQGKVDSIAVVGVFSSIKSEQEKVVADIVHQVLGNDVPVSLSSEIGSIGFIERENATILNAALMSVVKKTVNGLDDALKQVGIKKAKTYLCQNDGTLMATSYALQYPILTISSGPTNSIRGAAYLSNLKDAITLDIGGTTSDLGVLQNYFPRESSAAVEIGGVRTNFRMPDIISVGIGGGSIVHEHSDGTVTVGPDSVGYQITQKALVFGGETLTATDIAVKLRMTNVGDSTKVVEISEVLAQKAMAYIKKQLEIQVDQMKNTAGGATLILVGGGSIICPPTLEGVDHILRDDLGAVANAIGATIAQISGEFEKIYSYEAIKRQEALEDAKQQAKQQALSAGAAIEGIQVNDVEEVPLSYYPGNANRVKVKVVGNLAN